MKHTRTPSLLAATFATALLFSAGHVLADNPPNEPEENAQNDSSQPVTDTWITTKVKADLLATENVSGLDIKVETVDGVVTLTGAVTSQAQKDKAVEVAKQIKGVKRRVPHKRLKRHVAAESMYPENYDFSIVFDSVQNRKARHQMDKGHRPDLQIQYEKEPSHDAD